jgi:hypothetical protein
MENSMFGLAYSLSGLFDLQNSHASLEAFNYRTKYANVFFKIINTKQVVQYLPIFNKLWIKHMCSATTGIELQLLFTRGDGVELHRFCGVIRRN